MFLQGLGELVIAGLKRNEESLRCPVCEEVDDLEGCRGNGGGMMLPLLLCGELNQSRHVGLM